MNQSNFQKNCQNHWALWDIDIDTDPKKVNVSTDGFKILTSNSIGCSRKAVFDLVLEKSVFLVGLDSLEQAVSSFIHLCFTANIEYPEVRYLYPTAVTYIISHYMYHILMIFWELYSYSIL
jgi:hypothetical protein